MAPLVRAAARLTEADVGRFAVTASELLAAMAPLRRVVVAAVHEILVERAGRTSGWLRSGDAEMASVRAEDLSAAGTDLLARLRSP